MNATRQPGPAPAERLAGIEARLARIERRLGLEPEEAPVDGPGPPLPSPTGDAGIEFAVGETGFAIVGVFALLAATVFTLALPYPRLFGAAPSLAALLLGAGCLLIAGRWEGRPLLRASLRAASLVLLYFSALRLCLWGEPPILPPALAAGAVVISTATLAAVALALRWDSRWLTALALATGLGTALVAGQPPFLPAALAALAALAVAIDRFRRWPELPLCTISGIGIAYVIGMTRTSAVAWSPPLLLLAVAFVGFGSAKASLGTRGQAIDHLNVFVQCVLLGLFALHCRMTFPGNFAAELAGASALYLALAVNRWVRGGSAAATFAYAMTGYAALTLGIIGAAAVPAMFVWLALQSLVVLATAIWFRSRAIIVANFAIYCGLVLTYVGVAQRETGISLIFGFVALATAQVLRWQKSRLELKTGLMQNVYLVTATLIFPFALYHLVPPVWVPLAWVGAALFYYALNLIAPSPKHRWMGHATLLLTAAYLVVIGIAQFDPLFRNISFLVLGTVLLAVSLVFTRTRRRQAQPSGTPSDLDDHHRDP